MAADVPALISSLGRWENLGFISAVVVLVGAIGESLAEFTGAFGQHRKRVERLAAIILIVGLAGELPSLVKTSHISGEIIDELNKEAISANVEAEHAKERAAKANESAGQANERASRFEKEAAALRKQAEQEATARASLQGRMNFQGPRTELLVPNIDKFIPDLSRFAGQKLQIRINPSGIPDPKDREEMLLLYSQLQFLLGPVSGWSVSTAQGENGFGITVAVHRAAARETKDAANTLASVLAGVGLTDMQRRKPVAREIQEGSPNDQEHLPPELILLYVGQHP
jgi:hypothetical protein